MLLKLILILSFLSIVSYFLFDRDFLAPPTVVSLGFLLSSIFTYIYEERWGLEFSQKTVIVIAAGIIAIIIGGIIGVLLTNGFQRFELPHIASKAQKIEVDRIKILIICLFELVTFFLLFREIRRISGYSDWISAVTRYRELSGKNALENADIVRMPIITKNMVELSFVIAHVYGYIIGNNLAAHKKNSVLDWVPIILYSLMTIVSGSRANLIRIWLVILITYYIIGKRSLRWEKSDKTVKMAFAMISSVIAVGALFSLIREFAGRGTGMDPLYHVTFYLGCPIAAFDEVLKGPIETSNLWGMRTFFSLYRSSNVLFGWPSIYNFYSDFTYSPTGYPIGNTYTALKGPYFDFGLAGMMVVMAIFGVFYTAYYCLIRKKSQYKQIDLSLLMYCYVAYSFFMYFYSAFHPFMSHTIIEFIIELMIIRWFLLDVQFIKHYELALGRAIEEKGYEKKWKYLK